jgi:hypothetical protein
MKILGGLIAKSRMLTEKNRDPLHQYLGAVDVLEKEKL